MMTENNHTEDTIKNYLQDETHFALLIAGKWGSGKTYFYEHNIVPLAQLIQLPNSPLFFLPVRISLFGINSIDELESEVIASLYPLIKNTTLKAGANIIKAFTKGYIKNKFDVKIEDYIPDSLQFDKKDIVNKEHLLLCFDDLERRGNDLGTRQVIGYINSLVENNNSKVIILANEDQIEGEDYKSFKEKTIGISINFKQDITTIYTSFITKKYERSNANFYNFLIKNKDNMLNIFVYADSNLRIIIDGILRIEKIFNELQAFQLERIDEAIENVIRFSLGIHIEFKTGKLNNEVIQKLNKRQLSIADISWKPFNTDTIHNADTFQESGKAKKDYLTVFREKYFTQAHSYHFYESVYYFIVSYTSLNTITLFTDLREFFPDIQGESDAAKTYRILSSAAFGDLPINEYKNLTRLLIKYAQDGQYSAIETVSTFYLSTRLNNPLRLNKNKLAQKLIKGINSLNPTFYVPMLDLQLEIPSDHPDYLEMKQIADAALEINNRVLNRNNNTLCDISNTIFNQSIDEFIKYINSEKGIHSSLFGKINPRKFVASLKNRFSYNQTLKLIEFIKSGLYNSKKEDSDKDIKFLSQIVDIIDHLSKDGLNFQQKITFTELSKVIRLRISQGFREFVAD